MFEDCLKNQEFVEFYESRPENVKELIRKYPPDEMYAMDGTDPSLAVYIITSIDEGKDGSLTFSVEKIYSENFPLPGYGVFGIKPEDLTMIQKESSV